MPSTRNSTIWPIAASSALAGADRPDLFFPGFQATVGACPWGKVKRRSLEAGEEVP